jgi:hypothetical protein
MGGATRAIQPGWVLAALLAIQIGLGLLYASVTPIFEASDEIWHYAMVREIVANRRLPVQNPAIDAPWAQEGSQPPLYYALGALLTGWIDPADAADLAERNPLRQSWHPPGHRQQESGGASIRPKPAERGASRGPSS